ncbi:coiled-coil domain-containing protein 113 [Nasonia vitripennis]|uniref:Cilia- and flagella-associated protein 263 n=1 Tax=Nasonia vitripennis TaxID=7425 RepID=A0A7M7H670_NASVI|nr:coiled-coil domain-containing protein 113 [Nasonia vitripennis]
MQSERTSSLSVVSKLLASTKDEINFEEMSDEQLGSTLEEAMRTNRTLTLENEVFERYLRRRDPQCLHKLSYVVESARQAQKLSRLRISQQQPRGGSTPSLQSFTAKPASSSATLLSVQLARTASGSQQAVGLAKRAAKGLKITVAHRIELVEKEVEEMRRQYREFEKGLFGKKEGLETMLEEINYRIKECEDTAEQFENEVLNQVDPVSKRITADSFVKFVERQLKLAEIAVDKLNLKIVTTKRLIRQTKKQIDQREELGNTLRPVDFEKLKIENKYLTDDIERYNRTIKTLKQINGHYGLTLKSHKERLLEKKSKLQSIENELTSKERENVDLRRCQTRATREIRKAEGQLNHIKKLREEYEIPEVRDFLEVQKQLQEARKNFKRLGRRRKLQLFTLRSLRRRS